MYLCNEHILTCKHMGCGLFVILHKNVPREILPKNFPLVLNILDRKEIVLYGILIRQLIGN